MIDRVLNVMAALALAVLSFIVLGITSFNATYVFSGWTRGTVSTLAEWYRFLQDHKELARESLLLGSSGTNAVMLVASLMLPVLLMVMAKPSSVLVRIALAAQGLLLILDGYQLLSFPANGMQTGGYDVGIFYMFHWLLSFGCAGACIYLAGKAAANSYTATPGST
jgi:hypothetical protein